MRRVRKFKCPRCGYYFDPGTPDEPRSCECEWEHCSICGDYCHVGNTEPGETFVCDGCLLCSNCGEPIPDQENPVIETWTSPDGKTHDYRHCSEECMMESCE